MSYRKIFITEHWGPKGNVIIEWQFFFLFNRFEFHNAKRESFNSTVNNFNDWSMYESWSVASFISRNNKQICQQIEHKVLFIRFKNNNVIYKMFFKWPLLFTQQYFVSFRLNSHTFSMLQVKYSFQTVIWYWAQMTKCVYNLLIKSLSINAHSNAMIDPTHHESKFCIIYVLSLSFLRTAFFGFVCLSCSSCYWNTYTTLWKETFNKNNMFALEKCFSFISAVITAGWNLHTILNSNRIHIKIS